MSIQYTVRDLNPHPLEHEFPPITSRPGILFYYSPEDFGYVLFMTVTFSSCPFVLFSIYNINLLFLSF